METFRGSFIKSYLYSSARYMAVLVLGALIGVGLAKTYSVALLPIIVFFVVFPFVSIKYSIYALVFLIPYDNLVASGGITLTRIWGIYILAFYIVKNVVEHKTLGFKMTLVHKVALLFLPLTVLSAIFGIGEHLGLHALIPIARMLILPTQMVVFSIVIYAVVKEGGRLSLARVFLVACVIVSLLQIIKYFDILDASFLRVPGEEEDRVEGYTGDPNRFGMTILPAIYFGIASLIVGRNIFWKLMTVAGILTIMFTIAITISRGAILTLVLSLLIFTIWQVFGRGSARLPALIILCVIAIGIAYAKNTDEPHISALRRTIEMRFRAIGDEADTGSAGTRAEMAMVGVRMLMDNPLGVGLGNFYKAAGNYSPIPHDAHNSVVEVAGELGFPGLIWFLLLLFIAVKPMLYRVASPEVWAEKTLIFGLVAFFIASLTLTAIYSKAFWFLIGLSAAAGNYIKEKREHDESRDNIRQLSQ